MKISRKNLKLSLNGNVIDNFNCSITANSGCMGSNIQNFINEIIESLGFDPKEFKILIVEDRDYDNNNEVQSININGFDVCKLNEYDFSIDKYVNHNFVIFKSTSKDVVISRFTALKSIFINSFLELIKNESFTVEL